MRIRVEGFGIGVHVMEVSDRFLSSGFRDTDPAYLLIKCGEFRDWESRDGGERLEDLAVGLVPRDHVPPDARVCVCVRERECV